MPHECNLKRLVRLIEESIKHRFDDLRPELELEAINIGESL